MANWMPQPQEQPDGSYLFELRDKVFLSLRPHSPTKLQVQMWRRACLLPPDVGSLASRSFRDNLVRMAKEAFNEPGEKDDKGNVVKAAKINVPNIEEDIGLVATMLGAPASDGKSIQEKLQEQEGPSLAEKLISFAEEHGEFFHTADKEAQATVNRNGHTETYPLHSRGFRLWLKGEFRRVERQRIEDAAIAERERLAEQMGPLFNDPPMVVSRPPIIREQVLADALNELESLAINDGPEYGVHLRVARGNNDKVYVDLCNDEWQVVEIDTEGWRVVTNPPVKFVRSNTMRPLPTPVEGGSVEDLRKILTLSADDEDDKAAWRLMLAWLVQSLRPNGGQYPVLVLLGGQGSAKTNTGRLLRRLVDPSVVSDTSPPKVEHDLYIRGTNSWIISLDNVSTLPHWVSDAVCRIATEGGFATRKLYSGREEEVFDALRPFILNGIADVATRPDLLDRSLLVNLPAIKHNKPLRKVRAEFDAAAPGILGALLDAIVAGLNVDLDTVEADGHLPRLADFAQWAVATEEALGGEPGSFMKAYRQSRGEATETALEAEPIVYPLLKLAQGYSEDRAWEGTTKELLGALNDEETDEALKRSKDWPKTPRKLSELLKRLAPALIEVGVHAEKLPGSRRDGRKLRVFYRSPPTGGGDGTKTTVTDTVTNGKPINKGNTVNGDGGDGGDGPIHNANGEKKWGEV